MTYRNRKSTFVYPKNPYKRAWVTSYAGIVCEEWKEKCETPIIFLDIDGVMNSGDWANTLYESKNNPEAEHYPIWYHEWCDVTSVQALKDFCDKTGFMIVITSSWRGSNIFETFDNLTKVYGFRKLFPYIIGQTFRLNIGRTGGKSWIRGDEIKVWCDEYKPSWYGILDDDGDMLPEQEKHFLKINAEHGLHEEELLKFQCKMSRIHKRAWKEKFDFSFGNKIMMYNYNTKKYE